MKKLTQKQKEAIISCYEHSNFTSLDEVYKSYSLAKRNAFYYCVDLCNSKNGFDLRIISYNVMQFSVGFQYVDNETGVLMFAYITKEYDRFFEYPVY